MVNQIRSPKGLVNAISWVIDPFKLYNRILACILRFKQIWPDFQNLYFEISKKSRLPNDFAIFLVLLEVQGIK
jgi:hypothetical protein